MIKTELIKKMLDDMAEANNTIDLNAYSLGLSNMFDELKQVKNIDYEPRVSNNEVTVCDHKWREPNGCAGTYRNVCEKCGKDMRAN